MSKPEPVGIRLPSRKDPRAEGNGGCRMMQTELRLPGALLIRAGKSHGDPDPAQKERAAWFRRGQEMRR